MLYFSLKRAFQEASGKLLARIWWKILHFSLQCALQEGSGKLHLTKSAPFQLTTCSTGGLRETPGQDLWDLKTIVTSSLGYLKVSLSHLKAVVFLPSYIMHLEAILYFRKTPAGTRNKNKQKLKTKRSNNAPETKISLQSNSSKVEGSARGPPGYAVYKLRM